MNLAQAFKMAFKSIASKKTRSFLTMLGIIIGVASVVIMVSVVQGQNRKNMEYFEKMGDNKIQVYAYQYYNTSGDISELLYEYCLGMQDLVLGITPNIESYQTMTIKYGAKTFSTDNYDDWSKRISVKLGSDQYGVCNNYTLGGGRELSFLDVDKTNRVCVLGSGAKEQLFDFVDPVGETIQINGQSFLVVGWYEPMDLEGREDLDNIIVIPYTFNRTLNNNQQIDSYIVKARSAQATVQAMTKLTAYLTGFINDQNGYCQVYSDNSSADALQNQNTMQAMVLGGIAAISLLVGGIGIMNIMLVSVTERTREIGIRKSLGGKRRDIRSQFIIEAGTTSAIGGVIGIALGILLANVMTAVVGAVLGTGTDGFVAIPTLGGILVAFCVSVGVGILFGYLPANKAAKLNPIDALRYD